MAFEIWVIVSCAVVLGAIIQGSLGFGMNLLVAPLLGLIHPELLPAGAILLGVSTGIVVLVRNIDHVQVTSLRWAILGRVPGSIGGVILVVVATQSQLGFVCGISVLFAVAVLAFGKRIAPTPASLVTAGAVSGVMGTSTAIGGPPMAMVLMEENPENLRATMSGFLVFGTVLSTILLSLGGELTLGQVGQIASLLPALALGTALCGFVAPHLNMRRSRSAVLILSTISAVALLAKSVI